MHLYVSVVFSSQPPQDEDKPRPASRYIPPELSPSGQSNVDISWERRVQVCPKSSIMFAIRTILVSWELSHAEDCPPRKEDCLAWKSAPVGAQ